MTDLKSKQRKAHRSERPVLKEPSKESRLAGESQSPYAPLLVAHRGESMHAPENTFAAFELALRHGADMIELDVQRTRDGALVVLHDSYLDRTTRRRGPVREYALEELRDVDAGSWFAPEFAGERVPRLEQVIEWARGRTRLLVELKTHPSLDPPIDEAVAKLLSVGDTEHVVVYSSNIPVMAALSKRLPAHRLGVVVNEFTPRALEFVRDAGAALISQSFEVLTRHLVDSAHRLGYTVSCGVRHELESRTCLQWQVDWIVSDRMEVARLRDMIDSQKVNHESSRTSPSA